MRFRRRLILLYVFFCCLMGVVWLRATQLQWIDGDAWAEAARKQRQRTERLEAMRGPIVSGDGIVLAEDRPGFQLAVVAWDWQRRARARCSGCGAIYHQRGYRMSDGTLRLRFPGRCACSRPTAAQTRVGAFPRAAPAADRKPRLEALPPADLGGLERALGLEPGELDERASARVDDVEKIVRAMRARMEKEGDDSAFREKRLEMAEQDLLRRPYVLLGRVPEEAARLVLTDEQGTYEGFEVQTALRRHYPLGDFAAQLLGFTSQLGPEEYGPLKEAHGDQIIFNSRVGRKGLERAYNWEMHGSPGHRQVELDEEGQWGRIVRDEPPHPGKPLVLSVQAGVSREAERLLFADAAMRGARGYVPRGRPSGAFVIMDAYTGEILVWAEAPRFDLNDELDDLYDPQLVEAKRDLAQGAWVPRHPLEKPLDLDTWRERLVQPVPVGMSRVAQVAVEPGSTFKPLMALGLLQSGRPLPFATYYCAGGSGSPGCHHCGTVDLVRAIAHSCNRYFAFSVRNSENWPHYRRFLGGFFQDLGIGQRPSAEVPEWSAGQWLWPYVDFTAAEVVERAQGWLQARMGASAPELAVQLTPGAPETLGGDPERFGRRLGEVARWLTQRIGAPKLVVSLERVADVDQQVDIKVSLRAAARGRWHELPGTAPRELPTALADLDPSRAGVTGHLERGGSVWFIVRLPRRVGRASAEEPPWIRPEDGRNVAIGQGPVLVTPLHMVRAMAVLANGGLLVQPHVVRAVGGREHRLKPQRLSLDPRHIERVREGMYRVVNASEGTADHCEWHRVPATVYGKTGTAQVGGTWKPFGETEDGGPWHHWFVGFAEAPGRRTIAFACVLHSRSEPAAGLTAAPATVDILERWYASKASLARD